LSITISLALAIRLGNLDQLSFVTDQARAMLAGRNILLGHWVGSGPDTSVPGLSLGPLYYYLTAGALAISHFHPIGPTVMVALGGGLTAVLLSWYVGRYYSPLHGWWVGVIYALSPLAIAQSRIALEPSLVPLMTVLWLVTVTKLHFSAQKRWLALALIIIGLGIQLNFSFIVLMPATLLIWHHLYRQRTIVIGLGLSIIAILLIKLLRGGQTTELSYWWQQWQMLTITAHPMLSGGVLFIAFIGFIFLWRQHRSLIPVILLWIWWAAAGFALKHVAGDHSLAILFPLPAILIAAALTAITQRLQHSAVTWTLIVPIGLLLIALNTLNFVSIPPTQSWSQTLTQAKQIIDVSQNHPYAFLYRGHLDVYAAGDDHWQYALWWLGHPPAASARRFFTPTTTETWLLNPQLQTVKRIIIYYSPAWRQQDFAVIGRTIPVGDNLIEVVDTDIPGYNKLLEARGGPTTAN
jgi:4-amino-4-deoxy-L-arabinose transferase-like glycosyltransferase